MGAGILIGKGDGVPSSSSRYAWASTWVAATRRFACARSRRSRKQKRRRRRPGPPALRRDDGLACAPAPPCRGRACEPGAVPREEASSTANRKKSAATCGNDFEGRRSGEPNPDECAFDSFRGVAGAAGPPAAGAAAGALQQHDDAEPRRSKRCQAEQHQRHQGGGIELRRFTGRGDRQWRQRDRDLAWQLEYPRPRNIRKLIKSLERA
jgi:hypothetical protein